MKKTTKLKAPASSSPEGNRSIRIFIGSSQQNETHQIAKKLVERLNHTVVSVGPAGMPHHIQPVPWWDAFQNNEATITGVLRNADECDFGIFLFHPDDVLMIGDGKTLGAVRDNVLLEYGLFLGSLSRVDEGKKRVAVVGTSDFFKQHVAGDLLSLSHTRVEYTGDADACAKSAVERLKKTFELGPRRRVPPRRIKHVLGRGDVEALPRVADGSLVLAEDNEWYLRGLEAALRGGIVPAKFLYWSEESTQAWLEVCKRGSYSFYRDSFRALRMRVGDLVPLIRRAAGTTELDVVSLGCGDGRKDAILLEHLCADLAPQEEVYYYPIDISEPMLGTAIREVRRVAGRKSLRFKAIVGDFLRLPEMQRIFEYRANVNLFCVMGNTIGNADELRIMDALRDSMLHDDLVLIEIALGSSNAFDEFAREQSAMEHDFSPLKTLGFELEADLLQHRSQESGSRAKEFSSFVPRTQTVLTLYKRLTLRGVELSNVILSVVHHYELESFCNKLRERVGVKILSKYPALGSGGEASSALVLAQMPRSHPV